jgi:hypothetical protein
MFLRSLDEMLKSPQSHLVGSPLPLQHQLIHDRSSLCPHPPQP